MSDLPSPHVMLRGVDMASLFVALATLTQILPALAALLSCIWYLIRIGEWLARKLRRPAPPGGTADPADSAARD
jgi:hypothetical protein